MLGIPTILKSSSVLVLAITLTGCAGVSAVPLNQDGINAVSGAAPGFRYYPPKPYLLVTDLPQKTTGGAGGAAFSGSSNGAGTKSGGGQGGASNNASTGVDQAAQQESAPATTSDLSFFASTPTYQIKLIYLPDYRHPMALSLRTGLFGTSSVQLSLEDGWMLTSVSANIDNSKLADVVTAALQALGGGASGGATKAASTAGSSAKGLTAGLTGGRILAPGLYAVDFSPLDNTIPVVCAVAYFDSTGSHAPQAGDPGACTSSSQHS